MKFFITFITFIALFFNAIALETPKLATLEIIVEDFDSNEGHLRVHLFNTKTAKYFPDKSNEAYKWQQVKIKNGKVKVVFKDIPYGRYAATLHHDSNNNEKMDLTWLGMPDEGWGLSTDVIPVFSLPDFEDCAFDVYRPVVQYKIKIRYLP